MILEAAQSLPRLDEYFGVLAYHEARLQQQVDIVNRPGWLANHMQQFADSRERKVSPEESARRENVRQRELALQSVYPGVAQRDYQIINGIALIDMSGSLMKQSSSFGGASYVRLRQQVRDAVRNPDVKGLLLRIDSPGGSVSGCDQLGKDIAAAAKEKPVHFYGDDLIASAALWCGVQAPFGSIGDTCCMGSIGVFMTVVDYSKMAEEEGLKVHRIATGPLKGAGVPGTVITEDQLAEWNARVNTYFGKFIDAGSAGRQMDRSKFLALATGGCWIGQEVVDRGLADAVETFDEAMERLVAKFTTSSAGGFAASETGTAGDSVSTTTSTENTMAAATFKELKAAFPKASAEFINDQQSEEADMKTASENWTAFLELEAEEARAESARLAAEKVDLQKKLDAKASNDTGESGVDANLGEVSGGGGGESLSSESGDAISDWNAALKEKQKEFAGQSNSRSKAVRALTESDPDLRARYVAAWNDRSPVEANRGKAFANQM